MKTSHRSLFVAVLSLLLTINNGAFLAVDLIGIDAPGSQAEAALTVDLGTSTAVAPEERSWTAVISLGALLFAQAFLILLVFRRWRD